MGASYLDSLDVANRACQHMGCERIEDVDEISIQNRELSFAYDKVRRSELQRNDWRFGIKTTVLRAIDENTMLLQPTAWSASMTYLPGAIVNDTNGLPWISTEQNNINNEPGVTGAWDMYSGPLSISLYDSTIAYYAGELVYKVGAAAGQYTIFMSLQNANDDDPGTADAWDATVTYKAGETVSYSGTQWRSLIELNLNVTPANGPLAYSTSTTYSAAQTVTGSDNYIYSSVGGSNIGHDPVTDAGVHWTNTGVVNGWTNTPTITASATSWRPIAATMTNLSIIYPVGSGPSGDGSTRNVYRLPAGYLSNVAQDPKAGSVSYLGAPSGLGYSDWDLQGQYIVSRDIPIIVFRFMADFTKVSDMDDLFCEGFACSLAIACAVKVTQSDSRLGTIASEYKLRMGDARTKNAIEVGSVEPPLDDFITCRM